MNIAKANYQKHRSHILPIIERTDEINQHDFANEIGQALLDGRAFLFLTECGFFILQPTVKGCETWVNIMFAYSFGTVALASYMNEISDLAKVIDAAGVELYTVVKKLGPFLIRKGFIKDSCNSIITLAAA